MLELAVVCAAIVLLLPIVRAVLRGNSLLEPEFSVPGLLLVGYVLLPAILLTRGDIDGLAPDFRGQIYVSEAHIAQSLWLVAVCSTVWVLGFYGSLWTRRPPVASDTDSLQGVTPFRLASGFAALVAIATLSSGTAWLTGDWTEGDGAAPIAVLTQILTVPIVVLAGVLDPGARTAPAKLSLRALPFVTMMALSTSRSLMFPLLLFVVAQQLVRQRRVRAAVLLIPVLALLGVTIGLVTRSETVATDNPGMLGTATAIRASAQDSGLSDLLLYGTSALPSVVLTVAAREQDSSVEMLEYFRMLLPIPSSVMAVDTNIVNLASRYGIGGLGIPMPALGELYFFTGWVGSIVVTLLAGLWFGRLQARFDQARVTRTDIFLYLVTLFGLLLSLHSGVRASTRHLLYTVGFLFLLRTISGMTIRGVAARRAVPNRRAWDR